MNNKKVLTVLGVLLAAGLIYLGARYLVSKAAERKAQAEFEDEQVRLQTYQYSGLIYVDQHVQDLAWDGRHLWVLIVEPMDYRTSQREDGSLLRIDPLDGKITAEVRLFSEYPTSLVWDGAYLWVGSYSQPDLQKVDTDRLEVIQMISTNFGISTLLWDESNLWAGSQFSTSVQKIDPVQGIVTQKITLQYGLMGIAAGSGRLWAAETDDNLAEGPGTGLLEQIDPQAGKVARQVPLDYVPWAIAATQEGLWVTGPGSVYQYAASSGNLLAEVPAGGSPYLLFSDGDSLWATYRFTRGLMQIDPRRAQVISRRADQSIQDMAFDGLNLWVVACPYEMVCWVQILTPSAAIVNDVPVSLTWDGSQLWITEGKYSGYGGVQRFDPATGLLSTVIPLRGTPSAAAWDGRSLWVADFEGGVVQLIDPTQMAVAGEVRVGDHPVALAWDGVSLWVCSMAGSVSIIDPQKEQVVGQIPMETTPTDILWAGGSIWVESEQGVHKIDPQSLAMQTFPAPGDHQSIAWSGETLWLQLVSGTLLQMDPNSGEILSSQLGCEWSFEWPVEKCRALPPDAFTGGTTCSIRGAAWDGETLWTFCGYVAVAQIDPHTRQILTVIAIEDPQAIAWDGAYLWVANRNTLQRLNVHYAPYVKETYELP